MLGWYKQRRNTDQRMTFKEQVVHRNLRRALRNHELVFLLLTSKDASAISSTHCLEYSVFISHGRLERGWRMGAGDIYGGAFCVSMLISPICCPYSQYHKIPVLVGNLGMLEQQDYWRTSTCCLSSSYSQAVKKHRWGASSPGGGLLSCSLPH